MPTTDRVAFDKVGTLLLALTLAAYALAMTLGHGDYGAANLVLLLAAGVGAGLFIRAQARASAPLVPIALLRDPAMGASLAASALVSTVMMATLVVGPFYLSMGLGLDPARVGIVMSVGPVASAVSGVLAGRSVDRLGPPFAIIVGLNLMAIGTFALPFAPAVSGAAAYVSAILVLTPGYQLFQAANNTAVMLDVSADRRGVVPGCSTCRAIWG
jgi:predicted MFS family arabinose efflux permease